MPTPPTINFVSEEGAALSFDSGGYQWRRADSNWSYPQIEIDVIRKAQRGGVSVPYVSISEREFALRVHINGGDAAGTQALFNALIDATAITRGGSRPRYGVLTWNGYGASSEAISIRCAAKEYPREWRGLTMVVTLMFTSPDGLWYHANRLGSGRQVLAVGGSLPVVGINDTIVGDALPWAMGTPLPHVNTRIEYAGSAVSSSLEALVEGPSEAPVIQRGDVRMSFGDTVPDGLRLRVRMEQGARHFLLDSAGVEVGELVQLGDSFPVLLAPGTNDLIFSQQNQIDGAYNGVTYSWRNEFISSGV